VTEPMRAFVAVEVSESARQQIARLLERLKRESGPAVRWAKPELMHLTLVFLGEVPSSFLESAKPGLAAVARQHQPFEMKLSGLGAFPGSTRARVVWIGIKLGRREVCALQRDAVKALHSVGYEPERRPFSPHLTIGRMREPADVTADLSQEFETQPFEVGRFALFRSVLGPGGPTYSTIADFPLGSGRVHAGPPHPDNPLTSA
jgi:2'-5' RNA ligase